MNARSANVQPPRMGNLSAALCLALSGLSIFPARVSRNSGPNRWNKCPLVARWQQKATTDPQQIQKWWRHHPTAVPGIELGRAGLVVIDADRHGGPDGVQALASLIAEYGHFPAGPVTVTAGGGNHYFLSTTQRREIRQ